LRLFALNPLHPKAAKGQEEAAEVLFVVQRVAGDDEIVALLNF